jgi:hypothetical protein
MCPGIECFSIPSHFRTRIGGSVVPLINIVGNSRRISPDAGVIKIIIPRVAEMVTGSVIPVVVRPPVIMVSVIVVPVVWLPWIIPDRAVSPVP